ncbi:MAG: phosphotransferase [Anaerolineaceae bacterium]|nr:phosphotransferase [Anaerolineaceae bacterium]
MKITTVPTELDAIRILHDALGKQVQSIHRFPTGLAHYVYDVETDENEKLVIRLARPNLKYFFEGALNWYEPLRRKNVPLPELYFSSLDDAQYGFPMMIMERLPGKDLNEVYTHLTTDQKHRIADQIIAIQQSVATLPMGKGYGYARSADDPSLYPTWLNVLEASIQRSQHRFETTGFAGYQAIQKVKQAIDAHGDYFKTVLPICFLDDTTTKNVLVDDNGLLSGIVDVDAVAFGDPLLTISLTRMALLSSGYDTDYTDYWAAQLSLTPQQQQAINLYTALYCLDFLSELGQSFNKETPITLDQTKAAQLMSILESLLA